MSASGIFVASRDSSGDDGCAERPKAASIRVAPTISPSHSRPYTPVFRFVSSPYILFPFPRASDPHLNSVNFQVLPATSPPMIVVVCE